MARTMEPHSASAQFFINVGDNSFLNHSAPTVQGWGYAVFGKVVSGMPNAQKILAQPTGGETKFADQKDEWLKKPVIIETLRRV